MITLKVLGCGDLLFTIFCVMMRSLCEKKIQYNLLDCCIINLCSIDTSNWRRV